MFCKLDVRRKLIVTMALSQDDRKIVVRYFVNRAPGEERFCDIFVIHCVGRKKDSEHTYFAAVWRGKFLIVREASYLHDFGHDDSTINIVVVIIIIIIVVVMGIGMISNNRSIFTDVSKDAWN